MFMSEPAEHGIMKDGMGISADELLRHFILLVDACAEGASLAPSDD